MPPKADLPQGTLDLLILKVLALGPLHGYGIAQRLQQISRDVISVTQGTLYPALHRLEHRQFLAAEWKISDTGREAKFYRLTRLGRAHMERETRSWERLTHAIGAVFKTAEERVMKIPLFRRPSADDRLDQELRDHQDRQIADYVARGMSEPEARRRVRLELGGLEQTKELCRDVRPGQWLSDLGRDIRLGVRRLAREPVFALSVIVILSLGIGTSVTMFSVLNAVDAAPVAVRAATRSSSV